MPPKNIATNRVILFDDHFTESKRGFTTTMNPAPWVQGPVIVPDQPWEVAGILGDSAVSVVDDDGLIRLWYACPHPSTIETNAASLTPADLKGFDRKTLNDIQSAARMVLCYAESEDGVHFEKPKLDVIRYKGKRTNMIFVGRLGATVLRDTNPQCHANARYKLIHGHGPRLPNIILGSDLPVRNIYHAIYSSYSSDGIHWKTYPGPSVPWYTDTTNVAYWDDQRGKYVAFMRWNEGKVYKDGTTVMKKGGWKWRAIGRTESPDFRRFPRPKKIAEPSKAEALPRATGMDYYNTAAVKYPFAPDSYFLFSPDYYHDTECLDVHLATSRDGTHYVRHKTPWLGLGLEGAFDQRRRYMGTGMVRRGDELWMYYLGVNYDHSRARESKPAGAGGIGQVRLPIDRFASQDASRSGGKLTTKPIRFDGNRLEVNMDAAAGGRLKVELRGTNNRPIPGFTSRDADWLYCNDVHKTVTWRGRDDLCPLRARTVRLHFIGHAVKVYAFQFTK